MAFSSGYDMLLTMKFDDGLGKLYSIIAALWTALLCCGLAFLVRNRRLPFLRIRNVPLTVSAVVTLHVYWVLCMLAYGLNGYFPCGTEFWIMNIYLPFGIALFNASNSQLLYISSLQRRYANDETLPMGKDKPKEQRRGWKRHLDTIKADRSLNRTMYWIAIGMLVQFLVAILVFLSSRRFHRFGIFGKTLDISIPANKKECRRGLEWLPSIFWQFFWSWIYAPYLLWKVRRIRDVHGWRKQTIVCCAAGLPASPMWLVALYLPQMAVVSNYFIPPLWFAPSIFVMEVCMVFVPCWQVRRNHKLKQDTLQILSDWEKQTNRNTMTSDLSKTRALQRLSTKRSTISSSGSTTSSRKAQSHMYTMVALEKALNTNPTPLLLFAALKDFSGENISFLTHVLKWKKGWRISQRTFGLPAAVDSNPLRQNQFKKAVDIFLSFVSPGYSNFPINISSAHLKELQAIFEGTAKIVNADFVETNAVSPFDDHAACSIVESDGPTIKDSMSATSTHIGVTNSSDEIMTCTEEGRGSVINSYQMCTISDQLPNHVVVPERFGPDVFDNSMESIKYTVLTNTWPKFVNAGYASKMEKSTFVERFQMGCF